MKRADFEREPCHCGECRQAGVEDKLQLRDPQSGKWLHGYDLRRCYEAADRCLEQFRALVKTRGL